MKKHVTPQDRYRVRVVTRRKRTHPFQLHVLDRLTNPAETWLETIRDLTSIRATREAEERAAGREAQLNGRADGPVGPGRWPEIRDQALATIAAETRPATLVMYRKVVHVFERYAEDALTCRPDAGGRRLQYVEQITPVVARGYPAWRKGHNLTRYGKTVTSVRETTVNRDLRHLLAFWNRYLVKMGLAATNPWVGVGRLRTFLRQPTRLSTKQLAALLEEAGKVGLEFQAALTLAAATGPRIGELSHLTWRHVDVEKGAWLITEEPCGWRPKGVEERLVGFTPETGHLLEEWRSSRIANLVGQGLEGDDARLLVNAGRVFGRGRSAGHDPWEREFNHTLKRACLVAGIPPITCHGLRFTVGRLAADAGATPWQVQAMLGHASMQTTLHYVGRDQPGAARAAFDALSGSRSTKIDVKTMSDSEPAGWNGKDDGDATPGGTKT